MAEWKNAKTGEEGRHHVDEQLIQKAVRKAASYADLIRLNKLMINKRGHDHVKAINGYH